MKARIFASIIITGILASSAAQAGSAITVEEINASYLNPSVTRNADVSNYLATVSQGQHIAQKPTCNLRAVVVKNDYSAVKALFPKEPSIGNYLAQSSTQYVCS